MNTLLLRHCMYQLRLLNLMKQKDNRFTGRFGPWTFISCNDRLYNSQEDTDKLRDHINYDDVVQTSFFQQISQLLLPEKHCGIYCEVPCFNLHQRQGGCGPTHACLSHPPRPAAVTCRNLLLQLLEIQTTIQATPQSVRCPRKYKRKKPEGFCIIALQTCFQYAACAIMLHLLTRDAILHVLVKSMQIHQ